jgi:hypothetical protein
MNRNSVMEGCCCEGATVCNRSADLLAPGCCITVSLPAVDFSGLIHSMRLANADSLLSSERSRSSCPYAHARAHVQSILNTTNEKYHTRNVTTTSFYRRLLKETQRFNGKYSIFMSVLRLTFENAMVIAYSIRFNIKNFP